MNTRRKFLLNGSMATTALFIANPIKTFSNTIAQVTGFSDSNNKLVLVHTGNYKSSKLNQTIKHIAEIKRKQGNVVLLHAGNGGESNTANLNHDASMKNHNNFSFTSSNYSILHKGKIKIGIVNTTEGDHGTIHKTNVLAAYLKKEKNCHIVVCLSQLGYKTKNNLDDITLAAKSAHLDIIIGGHEKNNSPRPVVAYNINKQEVLINHSAGNHLAFGKIEIDFDELGKKKQISFRNPVPRSPLEIPG